MRDDLYAKYSDAIETAIAVVCARFRLRRADADEFAQWARMRTIENDARLLRAFRGESALTTYLVAVFQRDCVRWRSRVAADQSKTAPVESARKCSVPAAEEWAVSADVVLASRVMSAMYRAILRLNRADEELLRLRFRHGLTMAEIASETGATANRVQLRLALILRHVRANLTSFKLTREEQGIVLTRVRELIAPTFEPADPRSDWMDGWIDEQRAVR